ncbi:hypothetical protein P9112_004359 [Eukaryota sp. TZLM1-RC]
MANPIVNSHTGKVSLTSHKPIFPRVPCTTPLSPFSSLHLAISSHFSSITPSKGAAGPLDELHQLCVPPFTARELDHLPSLPPLPTVRFSRDPVNGSIIGTSTTTQSDSLDPNSSSSINRKSLPLHKRAKGSVDSVPFAPASSSVSSSSQPTPVTPTSDPSVLLTPPLLTTLSGLPPGIDQPEEAPKELVRPISKLQAVNQSDLQATLDAINYSRMAVDIPEVEYDFELLSDNAIRSKTKDLKKSQAKSGSLMLTLEDHDEIDDVEMEKVGESQSKSEESQGPIGFSSIDQEFDEIFEDELDLISSTSATRSKTRWASFDQSNVSNFNQLISAPALTFNFELDVFQKRAILKLEEGKNVFVAAHTSAGKTVVAEYAIAMSRTVGAKAIYTSPIKSLSNQKYRDFRDKFGDVGIMTGDVSLNPTASCLIMTTEILRNLLYRGADVIRDVSFVIFDECHYLNDPERGVVYEECLILLPSTVQSVLLSATVPNLLEFAEWVGRIQKKEVCISTTSYRPVPLQYFLTTGTTKPIRIIDENGNFDKNSFKKAKEIVNSKGKLSPQWVPLINFLKASSMLPCLIFCFSKKGCERVADELSCIDFQIDSSFVHFFIKRALSKRISPMDQNLPQILRVSDLLSRGIGVHHAGLLPILKEITEMLFQKGYLKVLICTESMAMGVNLPATSVIFAGLRKHDGVEFRYLLPSEFTQISGRAGRRGLDSVGNVLMAIWDDLPDEPTLMSIVKGKPTQLHSQFRLTYNMILKLMRTKTLRIEEMLRNSFSEHHLSKLIPSYKKTLMKMQSKLDSLPQIDCPYGCNEVIEEYYTCNYRISNIDSTISQLAIEKDSSLLRPGVFVLVSHRQHFDLGLVLTVSQGNVALLLFESNTGINPYLKFDLKNTNCDKFSEVTLPLSSVVLISRNSITVNPVQAMRKPLNQKVLNNWVLNTRIVLESNELKWHDGKSLKLDCDLDYSDLIASRVQLQSRAESLFSHQCPRLCDEFPIVSTQMMCRQNLKELQDRLSDAALSLIPDLEGRTQILQALNYIDEERNVLLKGRVACELNTVEDLIITEMIFENILQKLSPPEAASLLSLFIAPKSRHPPSFELPESLLNAKNELLSTAIRLGTIEKEYGFDVDAKTFVSQKLSWSLMDVVYHWANGESFESIVQFTDIPEGTIVRSILRLDETCRDVRNAAFVIGDRTLSLLMEEVSRAIRRDIVFAASLYLS